MERKSGKVFCPLVRLKCYKVRLTGQVNVAVTELPLI